MRRPIPIVEVEWLDAATGLGAEVAHEDLDHFALESLGVVNHTVGFKIRDNEEGLVLAWEYCDGDGKYRHVTDIPRAYVKKVMRLKR